MPTAAWWADNSGVATGVGPVGEASAAAVVHGYVVAFWWVAGIFLFGAVVCGSLMRRGPLRPVVQGTPAASAAAPAAFEAGAETDPAAGAGSSETANPVSTPE